MGLSGSRRARAGAYTLVTSTIVLVFALAEWAVDRYLSDRSRAASTAIEIFIVLVAALVFRPIHQKVEAAIESAFYKRKRQALAALRNLRRELSSFNDIRQMLRRVIEAVEQHLEARACAVYLRRDGFHAEASSFNVPAENVDIEDPLIVRLRSSGAPAQPPLLQSSARGSHAFPMTTAGELVGFLSVESAHGDYEVDEIEMLSGLAGDLAIALVTLDPLLRVQNQRVAGSIGAHLQRLTGRERELGDIKAALSQSRLVTLTGPGGVGKTSVALQCAADAADQYEHGVWLVNLAPIADPKLVASTMLGALGAGSAPTGGETALLLEHLRLREALVVIDNCEQLVSAVAAIVALVYAQCPRVTILATSRELLRVDGEFVYRLGSLERDAAIALFSQRAIAASPSFEPQEHLNVVGAICEHLDGIPLAIGLAAARVRALSVDEIFERLHERFRLLTGGSRTALPRQQTLAALIEWSYDLLSEEEQSLFRRLGAFRGSFTLAAASAVCAHAGKCDEFHVLDILTSLADKSLLNIIPGRTTRHRLLETIGEFARQQSTGREDAALALQQHAAYFAGEADRAYREFDSHLPEGWLDRLTPDIDNFRSALESTLEGAGSRQLGADLAANCGPIFLRLELLGEGLRWCESARSVASLAPATAGRIEYVASMMHNNLGENRSALAAAERAVTFYEKSSDERGLVRALSQTAQLYARADRHEDAKAPAAEAIRRAQLLEEPRILTATLRRCAFSLPPAEIERARSMFAEALATAHAAKESEEACTVLEWWATCEAAAGFFERAISLASDGIACASGNARMSLDIQLACWALAVGRLDEAGPHARRALALAVRAQHPLARAAAIAFYAPVHADRDPRQAAMLFGYATTESKRLEWEAQHDGDLALKNASHSIAAHLEDGEFQEWLQRGSAWTEDEALAVCAP